MVSPFRLNMTTMVNNRAINVIGDIFGMKRQTVIIFYLLGVYVFLQFAWWGYHLIELTAELKKAKTVLWTGPMGVFGTKPFDVGTRKIADLATATQTEVGRMLAQQLASGSASVVDLMSRMVQSMPLTGTETMNILQSSLDSTRSAMEQMTKAGQEALSSLTTITTRAAELAPRGPRHSKS